MSEIDTLRIGYNSAKAVLYTTRYILSAAKNVPLAGSVHVTTPSSAIHSLDMLAKWKRQGRKICEISAAAEITARHLPPTKYWLCGLPDRSTIAAVRFASQYVFELAWAELQQHSPGELFCTPIEGEPTAWRLNPIAMAAWPQMKAALAKVDGIEPDSTVDLDNEFAAVLKAIESPPCVATDGEESSASDIHFRHVLDEGSKRVMAIAAGRQSANEKLKQISAIDHRFYGKSGKELSDLLGVSEQAIRNTAWWKEDRARHIG